MFLTMLDSSGNGFNGGDFDVKAVDGLYHSSRRKRCHSKPITLSFDFVLGMLPTPSPTITPAPTMTDLPPPLQQGSLQFYGFSWNLMYDPRRPDGESKQ